MASKTVVFFDFDGTLTTKDTLLAFFKFSKGYFRFYVGLIILSPMLIAMKLKFLPNWLAKEKFLTYFLEETTFDDYQEECNRFAQKIIPSLLRPEAMKVFERHLKNDHSVFIVSASPETWIRKWASQYGVEVIATKLEIFDGKMTGKLKGLNCYGPEKVKRIQATVDVDAYQQIYAYGDSRGDKEMLDFATHPFYKKFPLLEVT